MTENNKGFWDVDLLSPGDLIYFEDSQIVKTIAGEKTFGYVKYLMKDTIVLYLKHKKITMRHRILGFQDISEKDLDTQICMSVLHEGKVHEIIYSQEYARYFIFGSDDES